MNPNPQHKDVPSHLAHIRANSSYSELRIIITVLFWLGLISLGFAFFLLLGRVSVTSSKSAGEMLLLGITSAISALVLIALRIFFTMLIDMADSLLHEHTKINYRE